MYSVVKDDVLEVRHAGRADNCSAAHVHQHGTVAVQAEDLSIRLGQGDAHGDLRSVPHRADRQEFPFVALAGAITAFVKFTREFSRRGNNRIVLAQVRNDGLDGLLASHLKVARGLTGRFVRLECIRADQQSDRSALRRRDRQQLAHAAPGCFGLRRQDAMGNVHRFQQADGDLALLDVLRFVFRAGLAPPANQQQQWNAVDVAVGQRKQRIDRVALTGVLQVNKRHFPRGQMVSARQRHRPTFISRHNVFVAGMVCQVEANRFEQRIRHARVEIHTERHQPIDKVLTANHV